LFEYNTFQDMGIASSTTPPKGYKKVRVHLVFDVKHDGRHKVRCVADGHLPIYRSIVSTLASYR